MLRRYGKSFALRIPVTFSSIMIAELCQQHHDAFAFLRGQDSCINSTVCLFRFKVSSILKEVPLLKINASDVLTIRKSNAIRGASAPSLMTYLSIT